MAPTVDVQTIEAKTLELEVQETPVVPDGRPVLPDWLTEEYFVDVLEENVEGFKRIVKFEPLLTGGCGENYASILVRVKVKVELEDDSTKDLAYIVKTLPQGEKGAAMVGMMGMFPKEIEMYCKILPEFEQMYRDVGKTVRFGPKFYEFKKNPNCQYVLLEDIGPSGYKNANRLEGLDEEHILSVLKIVAQFHAASVVRLERVGEYETRFVESLFSEKNRDMLEAMGKSFYTAVMDTLASRPSTAKYMPKVEKIHAQAIDLTIKANSVDMDEFNVMIHGDLWANNIMFRYSESGDLEDTILIDFQMSRYASPVVELFYFLLSSTRLDLKVASFDKFVKFYHEQLVENLTLLKYSKKLPTLRDMHIQILKRGSLGFSSMVGIMVAVLMDPSEDANLEQFMEDAGESNNFQMNMFRNPRFLKHVDVVMEWLDLRGLLDF